MARVCWDSARVQSVIHTEAERMSESCFLATYDTPAVFRADRHTGKRGESITQEQFVNEFLAPNREYVNAVVLGAIGSGKSHFVRWLSTQIPASQDRIIKVIPNTGVNLRDVIRLLIEDATGEQFDQYRQRLDDASTGITPQLARERLLDSIAEAVGENGPFAAEQLDNPSDHDQRQLLIASLPALLRDESIRRELLKDEGIIAKLVGHTLGNAGRLSLDIRGAFTKEDLAVDSWEISSDKLMVAARSIFTMMRRNETLRTAAVEWINKNLRYALMTLLHFSGVDLNAMIRDVRASFAEQGKELVVLVEDFVRLEGIQNQFLQAFTQTSDLDNRNLCRLRLAVAVTTGPYTDWLDTYRDRMDLVVTLDNGALQGNDEGRTQQQFARFASRYLNAIRLEEHTLAGWHNAVTNGEHLEVPNACESCDSREKCFAVFGSVSGSGLYPFNQSSLQKLYVRVPEPVTESFVPRRMVKDVLLYTLSTHESDFRGGSFPNRSFLDHYGGSRMPVLVRTRLRESAAYKPENEERYHALFEFWGDPEKLDSVSDEALEAFGIPPLGQAGTSPRGASSPLDLEEIETWAAGGTMSVEAAQAARKAVHTLVASELGNRAGDRDISAFRPDSVGLSGLDSGASFLLMLGDDGDLQSAKQVLEAVVLFEVHHNWDFDGGAEMRDAMFAQAGIWADTVWERLPVRSQIPTRLQDFLAMLSNWANDTAQLGQELVPELREMVYKAINSHIDWDVEMLGQTFYSGSARPFRNTSINFHNQATQIMRPGVTLVFPLRGQDKLEVAYALQGALLYEHYGNWGFDDGLNYLATWANFIDAAASDTLRQLREPLAEEQDWDTIGCAVEVLAMGSVLHGTFKKGELSELLSEPSSLTQTLEYRSNAWRNLASRYGTRGSAASSEWSKVTDLLRAHIACAKGGQTANCNVLDPTSILPSLDRIKKHWQLSQEAPSKVKPKAEPVRKLSSYISSTWQEAVLEEYRLFEKLREDLSLALPDMAQHSELCQSVADVVLAYSELSRVPTTVVEPMSTSRERFATAPMRTFLQSLSGMPSVNETRQVVRYISDSNRAILRSRAQNFLVQSDQFLTKVETYIQQSLASAGQAGASVEQLKVRVDSYWSMLRKQLEEISGTTGVNITDEAVSTAPTIAYGAGELPLEAGACSLLDRCKAVLTGLERVKQAGNRDRLRRALQSREQQLMGYTDALKPICASLSVFKRHDVTVDLSEVSTWRISTTIRALAEEFSEDVTSVIQSTSNFQTLNRDFPVFANKLDGCLRTAWQAYVADHKPNANGELLSVLSQIHEFRQRAVGVQAKLAAVETISRQLPSADEGFDNYLSAVKSADDEWSTLNVDDLDQDVLSFLIDSSGNGAQLDSLSQTVVDWIQEKHIADSFRVVIRSDD